MNSRKAYFLKNIGIAPIYLNGSIKAILYKKPEDFIVEEIHSNFVCDVKKKKDIASVAFPQKYLHATLVKKGISTFEACKEIAEENGIPLICIGYCGLKDTIGLTAQRICILNRFSLKKTRFKKFFLKDFQGSNDELNPRSHQGNRFHIKARNVISPHQVCESTLKEFRTKGNKALPNFYGPQRFGIRQNNHVLGRFILEGDYDKFIKAFLIDSSKEESLKIRKVRKKLEGNLKDFKRCKKILGDLEGLEDERELIENLIFHPKEEAVCNTHRSVFFVHSFSSYLFNRALSLCLEKGGAIIKEASLDKIGADTHFDAFNAEFYSPILKEENMELADFKHSHKALNINSHPRKIFFFPNNFNFKTKNNEIALSFDLGIGEYASLFLGELFEGGCENKLN